MTPNRIALWLPPAEDHAAWQRLTGDSMSRQDYESTLAAIQADQERQGRTVVRVRMTVAQMEAELARRGLANETQNRARVIGEA